MEKKTPNPYESPQLLEEQGNNSSVTLIRRLLFVINTLVSLFLIWGAIYSILDTEMEFGFLACCLFLPPLTLYLFGELGTFLYKNKRTERLLGILNLWGAGFIAFAILSNDAEAISKGRWPDTHVLIWFHVIGLVIFSYLLACGLFRVRRNLKNAAVAE